MKIFIMCEKCGKAVELKSVDNGHHAYVHRSFIERGFHVDEIDIELSMSDDIPEGVTDIEDLDIDKELKAIKIQCNNCGRDYIVLTEFRS